MTLNINNKFTYADVERVTLENGSRYYICPETGKKLASVTTILKHTADNSSLEQWRCRVGEEKANKISEEATNLGSLMHENIECHITGVERPRGNNLIRVQARKMADLIISKGLKDINEVWGVEKVLYYPELYAGTTDLLGEYNNIPSITDFKTSKKIKQKSMIEDYFCQGAAYAVAHNKLYGTDISQIVIFMVSRDMNFEKFIITKNDFNEYVDKWRARLIKYRKTNNEFSE